MLQKSECSIFHNIFKHMIFQRHQKVLLWSNGLIDNYSIVQYQFISSYLISKQNKAVVFITNFKTEVSEKNSHFKYLHTQIYERQEYMY